MIRSFLGGDDGSGFYQTRITRTPGRVDPSLDQNIAAIYDPHRSGAQAVAASGLDEDTKRRLLALGYGANQGFITSQPGASSSTMRHESLHDIWNRAGLGAAAPTAAINAAVSPDIKDVLFSYPRYQQEAQAQGRDKVAAEEGSALQLMNYQQPSPGLIHEIVQQLQGAPLELSQFQRLIRGTGAVAPTMTTHNGMSGAGF